MSDVDSLRRFYVLSRIGSREAGDDAVSAVWQWKQEGQPPGTVLPDGFPSKAALGTVGYVASEDLIGADELELATHAGLTSNEAKAVFAALAAL